MSIVRIIGLLFLFLLVVSEVGALETTETSHGVYFLPREWECNNSFFGDSICALSSELESLYGRVVRCLWSPDEETEFMGMEERVMLKHHCKGSSDSEIEAMYLLLLMAITENTPPRNWSDFLSVERWTSDMPNIPGIPERAKRQEMGVYISWEAATFERDRALILPLVRAHLEDIASGWKPEVSRVFTIFSKTSFYRLDRYGVRNSLWTRERLIGNLLRVTGCEPQHPILDLEYQTLLDYRKPFLHNIPRTHPHHVFPLLVFPDHACFTRVFQVSDVESPDEAMKTW